MLSFRPMQQNDALTAFVLMRGFYDRAFGADAVSDETLWTDVQSCVQDCPYVDGWILERGIDAVGYALVSRGWDSVHARTYARLEELYIRPGDREEGAGEAFLRALPGLYENCAYVSLTANGFDRRELDVYRMCGYTHTARLVTNQPEK